MKDSKSMQSSAEDITDASADPGTKFHNNAPKVEATDPAKETAAKLPTATKEKTKEIVKRRRRRKVVNEKAPAVDPVLLDKVLRDSSLPSAYTFEIVKTVERILELNAFHVALQMPEGLLMYATVLADIFRRLAPCCTQVSVLGDVTYGGTLKAAQPFIWIMALNWCRTFLTEYFSSVSMLY